MLDRSSRQLHQIYTLRKARMSDIRFDGQVVIVTGAGGGLGRSHALEFARRGAKVVVNDLGGALDGSGGSSAAAEVVVAEIVAGGGEAIADGASVTNDAGVAAMVERAMSKWARIDVLVANAGILRDKSFAKMDAADFAAVVDVHLMGAVKPLKALWETMRAQNYGRIVVTTSSTGLYGNFGQSNYGAAKLALVGLMNTLKLEGAKNDVRINAISPVAATRMTDNLMPPEMLARFAPEHVTPGGCIWRPAMLRTARSSRQARVCSLSHRWWRQRAPTWARPHQLKRCGISGLKSLTLQGRRPTLRAWSKHKSSFGNPRLKESHTRHTLGRRAPPAGFRLSLRARSAR
jgi:NAD(P)-dependent dehydrogenase (short-subunit alcohol dehydrogenase family)